MKRMIANMLLIAALSSKAFAGELTHLASNRIDPETYSPDPGMECTHRFTGEFVLGDAEKIIAARPSLLCLDSPGGLLTEALKLTASMNDNTIATKIEAGARCESACALVFMAGGFWPHESDKYRWRVLHPKGRLGFHAPDLNIVGGNYDEDSVKKAYRIALKSVSETIANLAQRKGFGGTALKSSLLGQMLDTPAESMLYVETVDQAGRWDITVGPFPPFGMPSLVQLVHACRNAYAWKSDETAVSEYAVTDESWFPDREQLPGKLKGQVLLNEMFGTGCNYEIEKYKPFKLTATFDTGDTHIPSFYYFFPPTKKLSVLFEETKNSGDIKTNSNGNCSIHNGGSLLEIEPCLYTYKYKGTKKIHNYEWPSGSKTIIVESRNTYTINGVRTSPTKPSPKRLCYENSSSGNIFCFQE